jgi:hypothetical protein
MASRVHSATLLGSDTEVHMWIEAVFSREDLQSFVADLLPLKILLGQNDHHIELADAREVSLVAEQGVRVTCRAEVRWPLVGLELPIRLESVTALLKPLVAPTEAGDTLLFTLEIENLDLALLPPVVDRGIADKLNVELARRSVELSWNFAATLSHVFELPPSIESVDRLDLRVRWGKVRVTQEAMVMAVSFHPTVVRHERRRPESSALARVVSRPLDGKRLERGRRRPAASVLAWGAVAVGLFFALRAIRHAWS